MEVIIGLGDKQFLNGNKSIRHRHVAWVTLVIVHKLPLLALLSCTKLKPHERTRANTNFNTQNNRFTKDTQNAMNHNSIAQKQHDILHNSNEQQLLSEFKMSWAQQNNSEII